MSTLTYTVLKAQQEEEGAQQLGQLRHTVRTPQPRDWGSLFNFWVWSGEGAQLLASRLDYMEFAAMQATTEWKSGHIWDILATVQHHSFGLGISAPPPLVSELVWKDTAVLYHWPWPDYRGFKIPSFASWCHSSICAPSSPFLAVHEKVFFVVVF